GSSLAGNCRAVVVATEGTPDRNGKTADAEADKLPALARCEANHEETGGRLGADPHRKQYPPAQRQKKPGLRSTSRRRPGSRPALCSGRKMVFSPRRRSALWPPPSTSPSRSSHTTRAPTPPSP